MLGRKVGNIICVCVHVSSCFKYLCYYSITDIDMTDTCIYPLGINLYEWQFVTTGRIVYALRKIIIILDLNTPTLQRKE